MYLLSETEQHVRTSVRDAVLLLCQTGLKFNTELSVDGLLAVTLDKKHVFLLSIKETIEANEYCSSNEDSACLFTTDDPAVFNFSSTCLSSAGCDDHSLSNGSEHECTDRVTSLRLPKEMPSHGLTVADATPLDVEPTHGAADATQLDKLLSKSNEISRRRQRKQQRPTTFSSPVSLELSSQPEHVLSWMGNENSDTPVCDKGEDEHCNCACKTKSLSDVSSLQATAATTSTSANSSEQTFSDCFDEEYGKAISSLRLPTEDQKQRESETSVSPASPNKELVTNFDVVSKRSHRKQRRAVRRYLDSSTCCSAMLESSQTDHIPGKVNNENDEAPVLNEVENNRCKMELSDNLSDSAQTECQDLSTGLSTYLSANVKAEVVDPAVASADIVSQLASPGDNKQPSSEPDQQQQQQMALMSQFGLSAVLRSMQSHFALLPKPFPWSVRTFPSVSQSSIPSTHCGMVGTTVLAVISSDLLTKMTCKLHSKVV